MLPDGVTGTNNWKNWCSNANQNTCGAADHTLVDDDTAVNSYIHETLVNSVVTFTMANPSVASADIDTINSVTVKLKAHYTQLGRTRTLKVEQTGTDISNGYDSHTVTPDLYPLYTGTTETTYDGSTGWTYSKLENLRVKLTLTQSAARNNYLRVSYIYAEVDYTLAGYSNDIVGTASNKISEVNGIPTANISKVNGV